MPDEPVLSNLDSNVPVVLHGLLPTSEVHEAKSSPQKFYGTQHSEWFGRRRIVPACRDRSCAGQIARYLSLTTAPHIMIGALNGFMADIATANRPHLALAQCKRKQRS